MGQLPTKDPRCPNCGDRIKWAWTPSGKKIALEPGTDPNGRIMLRHTTDYRSGKKVTVAVQLGQHDAEEVAAQGTKLWIAHTAKCSAQRPAVDPPASILKRIARAKEKK